MDEKYVLHGPKDWPKHRHDSIGERIYNSLSCYQNLPVALIDAITKETVSFRNLLEKSCILANWMKNFGISNNDIVGIFSENSVHYYYPVLASMYLTSPVTAINPQYASAELTNALSLSKPVIVFCSQATLATLLKIRDQFDFIKTVVVIDSNDEHNGDIKSLSSILDDNHSKIDFKPYKIKSINQMAFILYSSGTTGLPKAVMMSHRSFHYVLEFLIHPRYSKTEKPGEGIGLGLLPFFHIFGLACSLVAFNNGRKIIVMQSFNPELFLRLIQDYKVNTLHLVPPLAVFLAKSPLVDKYDLSSVDTAICGAAPLSKKTEEALMKRLKLDTIFPSYGLTEATPLMGSTINEHRPGSCGKILPTHSVKIVDPKTGEALGPRQEGELCCKGDVVMLGYANNVKATREMIDEHGWLHSGDIAYYDEDGYFYVVDRIKELIKYKGFQVPPAELEAILLKHQKIIDAGVVGLPDETVGELPVAFVVVDPQYTLTEEEVKKFVAENISPHKQLHGGVRFVKEIPKNPSGKILRRKLRELLSLEKSKL